MEFRYIVLYHYCEDEFYFFDSVNDILDYFGYSNFSSLKRDKFLVGIYRICEVFYENQ